MKSSAGSLALAFALGIVVTAAWQMRQEPAVQADAQWQALERRIEQLEQRATSPVKSGRPESVVPAPTDSPPAVLLLARIESLERKVLQLSAEPGLPPDADSAQRDLPALQRERGERWLSEQSPNPPRETELREAINAALVSVEAIELQFLDCRGAVCVIHYEGDVPDLGGLLARSMDLGDYSAVQARAPSGARLLYLRLD